MTNTMNTEQMTADDIRSALKYFYGTENYYRFFKELPTFLCTDGVKTMAEICGAYWLIQEIALHISLSWRMRGENFVVYRLNFDTDRYGRPKKSAKLTADDGNGNALGQINIPYTDFPLPEGIKLYYDNGVLMLPTEY